MRKIKTAVAGESQKEYEARKTRFEELQRRRDEYMENERAKRDRERQSAADRLRRAREREGNLKIEIASATEKLTESWDKEAEAKANLAKTKAQFKRLGEEKLELVRRSLFLFQTPSNVRKGSHLGNTG